MNDADKAKQQLMNELQEARQRIAELQASETDRKGAEEELTRHREHLEELVEERTAQLEMASEELRRELVKRTRAEKAVRKSEERYRSLYESSKDGIAFSDIQGNLLDANHAFLDMVGYTMGELGKLAHQDLTPDKWRQIEADIVENQIIAGGYSEEYEKEYIKKDGTVFPATVRIWSINDEQGKPAGMWGIMRDMTEQKRTHQEMRVRDSAIASSINAIVITDLEWNLTYVNRSFLQMWGYDDETEVLGKAAVEFWQAQNRAFKALQAVVEGRSWMGELVAVRKDGSFFNVQVSATAVVDEAGKPICLMGSFVDITESRRIMDAASMRAEYLASIPTPVIVTDQEFNIEYINPAGANAVGKTVRACQGQKCFSLFNTEDCNTPECQVAKAMQTNSVCTSETIARLPSGDLPISYTGAPVKGRRGKIIGGIEYMVDISERIRAEEQLKNAVEELERSNAELEQFAYVASHDLQEPLRMVASYTQLLERRYKDKLDADANDFIGYAVGGAKRMHHLLDDLLAYSRVGIRRKPLDPTDCLAVFDAAVSNLDATIRDSGADVTRDALPTVMADEGQLVQLLQNLIDNAIKFRREEPPRVHVSAEQKRNEWVFSVRDNGIGIDPQYFERVFLIFQRLHREEYAGTGVGLAIARRIVERHGGRIWPESQSGQGTTVYFTIPAKGRR